MTSEVNKGRTRSEANGWRVEKPTAAHLTNPAYPKGLAFIIRGDCPVLEGADDWEICLLVGGEIANPPDDLDQKVDAWLETVAHQIAAAPDLHDLAEGVVTAYGPKINRTPTEQHLYQGAIAALSAAPTLCEALEADGPAPLAHDMHTKDGHIAKPGDIVWDSDVECVVLGEDHWSMDRQHIVEGSSVHCKQCNGEEPVVPLCDCYWVRPDARGETADA